MDLYTLIKPILFAQDAETAHRWAFASMGMGSGMLLAPFLPSTIDINANPVEIAGLRFRNRLGLAAGFDKNALQLPAWEKLGFGHVEIGTVTPKPQTGNARPRLFRLVKDRALINRMGFNNDGADAIRERLEKRPAPDKLIVGGNIGKNKDTSETNAFADYLTCLDVLQDAVDYFTINISSPNTQGLRNLQSREPLTHLLSEVQNRNQGFIKPKPIFVKIAPDLSESELEDIVAVAHQAHISGLVATNTTLSRSGLQATTASVESLGAGGLSGLPLREQAMSFCSRLGCLLPVDMSLIASGGVMTAEEVTNRLHAGARLVQLYTGFVYKGPSLIRESLRASRSIVQ